MVIVMENMVWSCVLAQKKTNTTRYTRSMQEDANVLNVQRSTTSDPHLRNMTMEIMAMVVAAVVINEHAYIVALWNIVGQISKNIE